jgi:hypothetical protein
MADFCGEADRHKISLDHLVVPESRKRLKVRTCQKEKKGKKRKKAR